MDLTQSDLLSGMTGYTNVKVMPVIEVNRDLSMDFRAVYLA